MADIYVGWDAAGTALDYATFADAQTAASAGDVLIFMYANNKRCRTWVTATNSWIITKAITLRGGLSNQGIAITSMGAAPATPFLFQESATVENFDINIAYAVAYCAQINAEGKSAFVRRCRMIAAYSVVCNQAGTITFESCLIYQHGYGMQTWAGTTNFYNCGLIGCMASYGYADAGGAVVCYNCWAVDHQQPYGYKSAVTGDYNAAQDSSPPGTHKIDLSTSDPKWWKDEEPDSQVGDYRIRSTSCLAGVGTDMGVVYDLAGKPFNDPPSIGPFEIWDPSTDSEASPTAEAAAITPNSADPDVILDGESVVVDGETINGTATGGTPTDPNYVISSQGGNWNDTDVVAANLVVGAAAGVSDAIVGTAVVETHIESDFPDRANVTSDDSVRGLAGTLDLPALNKVAPTDTLRGETGTMDLPAIENVKNTDTLEGVAGTLNTGLIRPAVVGGHVARRT